MHSRRCLDCLFVDIDSIKIQNRRQDSNLTNPLTLSLAATNWISMVNCSRKPLPNQSKSGDFQNQNFPCCINIERPPLVNVSSILTINLAHVLLSNRVRNFNNLTQKESVTQIIGKSPDFSVLATRFYCDVN